MPASVRQSHDMSKLSHPSGKLQSNRHPMYSEIEYPNIHPSHLLSSRGRG
jgi:hypothetical protein